MQEGPYAPAAVIVVAPHSYQAWVKLSDHPVTPRVRAHVERSRAQKYDGDVAHADMNSYAAWQDSRTTHPHSITMGYSRW